MSKFLFVITAFCLILSSIIFVQTASAGTTATVAATVTVQNVSVSVSSGTVTYGTLGLSTSKSTISTDLNDTQTATNNGNVAEDLNIEGQNSTDWTLGATSASEQYVHKFCIATCGTPPTNFTALTTAYQALATNIASSGTQNFDLQITTPSSTAHFTSESVNVTVQAVAH